MQVPQSLTKILEVRIVSEFRKFLVGSRAPMVIKHINISPVKCLKSHTTWGK